MLFSILGSIPFWRALRGYTHGLEERRCIVDERKFVQKVSDMILQNIS